MSEKCEVYKNLQLIKNIKCAQVPLSNKTGRYFYLIFSNSISPVPDVDRGFSLWATLSGSSDRVVLLLHCRVEINLFLIYLIFVHSNPREVCI